MRVILALAILGGALPLAAEAATNRFEAGFAVAPPDGAAVSSELGWKCAGGACVAFGPMSYPAPRICARLASEMGRLTQFSVNGTAFAPEALEKCNARAKLS